MKGGKYVAYNSGVGSGVRDGPRGDVVSYSEKASIAT